MIERLKAYFTCYWMYFRKMTELIYVLFTDRAGLKPAFEEEFGEGFHRILSLMGIPVVILVFFLVLILLWHLDIGPTVAYGHEDAEGIFSRDYYDTDVGFLKILKLLGVILLGATVLSPLINSVIFYHSRFQLSVWGSIWRVLLRDIVLLVGLILMAILLYLLFCFIFETLFSTLYFIIALIPKIIASCIEKNKFSFIEHLGNSFQSSEEKSKIAGAVSIFLSGVIMLIVIYVPSFLMLAAQLAQSAKLEEFFGA